MTDARARHHLLAFVAASDAVPADEWDRERGEPELQCRQGLQLCARGWLELRRGATRSTGFMGGYNPAMYRVTPAGRKVATR